MRSPLASAPASPLCTLVAIILSIFILSPLKQLQLPCNPASTTFPDFALQQLAVAAVGRFTVPRRSPRPVTPNPPGMRIDGRTTGQGMTVKEVGQHVRIVNRRPGNSMNDRV